MQRWINEHQKVKPSFILPSSTLNTLKYYFAVQKFNFECERKYYKRFICNNKSCLPKHHYAHPFAKNYCYSPMTTLSLFESKLSIQFSNLPLPNITPSKILMKSKLFYQSSPQLTTMNMNQFSITSETKSAQSLARYIFTYLEYFWASCHILCNLFVDNMLGLEESEDFEKLRKDKAGRLSKSLQKLRFEIEIENMNRTMEGKILIDHEDLIKNIFKVLSCSFISSPFYEIVLESIKNENSNITQELRSEIIKIFNNSGFLEAKSCQKFETIENTNKSTALTFLKKRELEIERIEKEKLRLCKNIYFQSSEPKCLKSKQIFKPRTIYHSMKNTFTSKKIRETVFYDKYESFDKSTEWSFHKSSSRRSNPSINDDDFDDEILVPKTPKTNNLNFEVRPISIHLDFSE